MTNSQLKRTIQKIEVDKDGNVDIYLRLLGDLGLNEAVLISDDYTYGWFSDEELISVDSDYREVQQYNFVYYSLMKICPIVLQSGIYRNGTYLTQESSIMNTTFLDSYTTLTHLVQLTEIEDDDTDNLLLMQNSTTHDVTLLELPDYVPAAGISTMDYASYQIDPKTVTVDGLTIYLTKATGRRQSEKQ